MGEHTDRLHAQGDDWVAALSERLWSDVESLERNEGYKGFNQRGVSEIMTETDPRRNLGHVRASVSPREVEQSVKISHERHQRHEMELEVRVVRVLAAI
jgi:hypothetical protein